MYRIIFLMAGLAAFFMGLAQQTTVLSLQQCIETALKNSPRVKESALLMDAAAINYRQAKSNLLPDLNGVISHGINQGRSIDPFTNSYINQNITYASYGIGSGVVLFNGMSLQNSIRQNNLALDASRMELQSTQDALTLNVIFAYLEVLTNEEMMELAAQQAAVTRQQVERLQILNREGAIAPPLLHEVTGQLKSEELAVVNNRQLWYSSKLLLTQLMNIPFDTAVRVEKVAMADLLVKPEGTATEVYTSAVEGLALVKAARLRSRSAEAGVKALRGNLFPTVVLNANLASNYSSAASRDVLVNATDVTTTDYVVVNGSTVPVISKRNNYESERIAYGSQLQNNVFSNIGVSLRVPLFNSFTVRNRIRLAEIDVQRSKVAEESTQLQVRQEVDQAHLTMVGASERYRILLEQVAAFNAAFKAAEVRFNAGVGTSVDYLLAKNNLNRANGLLITAQYDYLFRKRVLDFYRGK